MQLYKCGKIVGSGGDERQTLSPLLRPPGAANLTFLSLSFLI